MNPPTSPPPVPESDELEPARLAESYAGRVRSVEPSRDRGLVQARDGRQLPFTCGLVRVTGTVSRVEDLRPGMPVTFDLSHGPDGPSIVRLWVGEGPWQTPVLPDSL